MESVCCKCYGRLQQRHGEWKVFDVGEFHFCYKESYIEGVFVVNEFLVYCKDRRYRKCLL